MTKPLSFGSDGKLLEFTPQISDISGLQTALDGKANLTSNTFLGAQLIRASSSQDGIKISGRAGGTSSYAVTITPLALSANRTISAPDADGTIALLGENTFIGVQRFPDGTASAPALAFSADLDTGLFRIGANNLGISTSGIKTFSFSGSTFTSYVITDTAASSPNICTNRQTVSGTNGAVRNSDRIGALRFQGTDSTGAEGNNGAGFWSIATEDWASGAHGALLDLLVTSNGSASFTARLRVHESGVINTGVIVSTPIQSSLANSPKMQQIGTSTGSDSCAIIARFDVTPGDCPQFILAKSRGTTSTDFTAVASGDTLGILAGEGADGTAFIRAGSIRCFVDGTVSTGVVPGRWDIYTNNASGTGTLALRIDSSQNLTPYGDVLLQTGKVLKVAGTKVVGAQGSAIADVTTADATDLTSAIALANANKSKINSILAMVRTHGLIAT